jgi:putative ATP-binding cassette transporter
VFGLLRLVVAAGMWPAALADFTVPRELPITVAVFSILTYLAAHIPVVRQITRITDLYYEANERGTARVWPLPRYGALERRIAIGMVLFLVLINQFQVLISVKLNFFSRDWFNAIQNKDEAAFWQLLLLVFTPWAFTYIATAVIEFVVQSMLVIRWRRWLTEYFISHWLGGHAHYRMSLVGSEADNPDQRIAEDVNRFIDGGTDSFGGTVGYGIYSYSIALISTLSSLVAFVVVLWGLSENFTLPGTDIHVPGFLFWVALIYATVGTLVTPWSGSFSRSRRWRRTSVSRSRGCANTASRWRCWPASDPSSPPWVAGSARSSAIIWTSCASANGFWPSSTSMARFPRSSPSSSRRRSISPARSSWAS